MKRLIFILLVASLSAAGCVDDNPGYSPEPVLPGECRRGSEVSERFDRFERPHKLDILIAVDDSGNVVDEQERLAQGLPSFLETLEDQGLSVRVGVVTADAASAPGLAAAGTSAEGCQDNREIFADSESSGDWRQVAACNVVQGDDGQPRQQVLEVLATSVSERPDTLADFFRDDARLLLLVLTNEDDCSSPGELPGDDTARNECAWNAGRLTKVNDFVESIRGEASTPEGVSLAIFSGPPSNRETTQGDPVRPVCQGTLGAAYPANRLFSAAQAFGEQGYFHSLCTDDFRFGLAEVAERLAAPTSITLCPAERLVHEPLAVGAEDTAGDTDEVPLGEGGFLYFGPTETCMTGAVRLSPAALEATQAVEMRYCVD